MKKPTVVLLAGLALVGSVAVYAAGGSASDPLITLDYLIRTFIPNTIAVAGERINNKTAQTYQSALSRLDTAHQNNLLQLGGGQAEPVIPTASAGLKDQRFKRGDAISMKTGTGLLLLAGNASVSFASGAVIDTSSGQMLASGQPLTIMHRYLVAEDTTAVLSITSDTAVVSLEGTANLSPSSEIDYNQLAVALQQMGIFRGTGTAFGSGYDLESAPTRIEGLIMFLRLMGEENAALSYEGTAPFTDVPEWSERYVAYAYSKGYTNGISQTQFGTSQVMGAKEYVTFLLRAVGFQDSGPSPDFGWNLALEKGVEFGVLTSAEVRLLENIPFLRAQVAYLSYFSLYAQMKDGSGSLLSHLSSVGALDELAVSSIQESTRVPRLNF